MTLKHSEKNGQTFQSYDMLSWYIHPKGVAAEIAVGERKCMAVFRYLLARKFASNALERGYSRNKFKKKSIRVIAWMS